MVPSRPKETTVKLRLYLDVAPWMLGTTWQYAAYSNPTMKPAEGAKRYSIDVDIPDPHEPDAELPASVQEETT